MIAGYLQAVAAEDAGALHCYDKKIQKYPLRFLTVCYSTGGIGREWEKRKAGRWHGLGQDDRFYGHLVDRLG